MWRGKGTPGNSTASSGNKGRSGLNNLQPPGSASAEEYPDCTTPLDFASCRRIKARHGTCGESGSCYWCVDGNWRGHRKDLSSEEYPDCTTPLDFASCRRIKARHGTCGESGSCYWCVDGNWRGHRKDL